MFISVKIFALMCTILHCKCEVEVFKNELSDEIKTLAIGTAEKEFLLNHNRSVVGQTLSADFSKFYSGKWNCFVGAKDTIESVMSQIDAAPNSMLWFSYNNTHILLFKAIQCMNTYKEVLDETVNYKITIQRTNFDNSTADSILAVIKESIAAAGSDCSALVTFNWNSDSCYYRLSLYVYNKLVAKYNAHFMVAVGRLNSGTLTHEFYKYYYEVVFNNILDFTVHQNT